MRKFAAALVALATALPTLAAEPPARTARRDLIDKLVTLTDAEKLANAALAAAIDALENSATTPEQKQALQQLRKRALSRNTRDLWAAAFDRNLNDKEVAEAVEAYRNEAAEHAAWIVLTTMPEAMEARLRSAQVSAADLQAARLTMADMRTMAVALDARATDTNEYPESCDMETLRKLLEPTYAAHMATRDGWGHEFLYIGSPGRQGFRIVSAGSDGKFESSSRILVDTPAKKSDRFEDDIILQDTEWIQAPRVLLDKKE